MEEADEVLSSLEHDTNPETDFQQHLVLET